MHATTSILCRSRAHWISTVGEFYLWYEWIYFDLKFIQRIVEGYGYELTARSPFVTSSGV